LGDDCKREKKRRIRESKEIKNRNVEQAQKTRLIEINENELVECSFFTLHVNMQLTAVGQLRCC